MTAQPPETHNDRKIDDNTIAQNWPFDHDYNIK